MANIACTVIGALGMYVLFNCQGHIGTGPQNYHLWESLVGVNPTPH